ncbi:MAG: hypothetical protein QS748_01935 [Candidatus Endonucleobacter bathymodioli]|uniref:Transposase n=1 Tax=Candidatus Endonucleibacter bathymodioli TaxID=539814 RepID=A0AA90SRW6_9GAMM|nr:hypothetical protein [Candidatus Endonucleobacter bathymodioli]
MDNFLPFSAIPTFLKFSHLLERNQFTDKLFATVSEHLKLHDFALSKGSMVDATLISASSLTKSAEGKRDPDVRHTRKGISGTLA